MLFSLLRVCVHCCECALGWVKCRGQIPSMGHHTWPHTTSLSLSLSLFLVHVGHNYWHPIIATCFSQDNSSEFSPIMPDEVREHLIRDQRPFLHPESLQILQIHSSMTVLLLFSSPHSYRVQVRGLEQP